MELKSKDMICCNQCASRHLKSQCCQICRVIETERVSSTTSQLFQELGIPYRGCVDKCGFCKEFVYYSCLNDEMVCADISNKRLHLKIKHCYSVIAEYEEIDVLQCLRLLFASKPNCKQNCMCHSTYRLNVLSQ
jgi:hypothetical protein